MNDIILAQRYISKAHSAEHSGYEFNISFNTYRRLMRRKTCYYTGMKLTSFKESVGKRPTDRTIDRVDNTLGYIEGNVVTACSCANSIKSVWENPDNPLTKEMVIKIAKRG